MRRVMLLLLAAVLFLNGCGTTGEVENQAYALVLGIDRTDAGGIGLTMRIPRIGHSGNPGADNTSEEPYLIISAEGQDYPQALERLQWAAARELNLSHIKLIVVSEALAGDPSFPGLISRVAETRHLYTTAGFIVCEGRAGDFIEGQETILGTRLSSEIVAMFRHYADHGYIPRATFADLYYATRSWYSDPTAIWGFMDTGEAHRDSETATAIVGGNEGRLNAETTTASTRQYLGTALFRDGVLVGQLDAGETLCLNLMTGRVSSFTFAASGKTCILSTLAGPRRRVMIEGDQVTVEAQIRLVAEDSTDRATLDRFEAAIAEAAVKLIRRCQALGVEPFRFAEHAAAHFPTYDRWRSFGWRKHFAQAKVRVAVEIAGAGG